MVVVLKAEDFDPGPNCAICRVRLKHPEVYEEMAHGWLTLGWRGAKSKRYLEACGLTNLPVPDGIGRHFQRGHDDRIKYDR